jgi:xylulokinase
MRDLTVGIDIGTTAVKAIAVDRKGNIEYQRSLPHELCSPKTGYAEEDPSVWWDNTKKLLADIAGKVDKKRLGAVALSGMVPTLILLDQDGKPLYPSIQQNDARAVEEIGEFREEIDEEEYFRLTGNTVNQQVIFPKYRWLERHHPELVGRTGLIMGSYNYCTYRLTGVPALELNWALESGMWLIRERRWLPDILEKARISEGLLPPVHAPTDIVGQSTAEVERETGFPSGVPVAAGSADHVASALAAGVREEGDLLLKLGGAGDILFATRESRVDRRLFIDYHNLQDRYLLNGCMASSGSIVKWFSREFALTDLEKLDRQASAIEPGAAGLVLLPYFLGEKTPIFDVHARGVYFGLSLFHSKYHLFRAILESVAFGFMHHLEVIREMGFEVRNVYLSNGGARSDLWKRIVLDAVGYSGHYVPDHPGSSLGAAFVAAQSVGLTRNWEGLRSYLKRAVKIPFSQENHRIYQRYFQLYKKLYLSLKPLFRELQAAIKDTEEATHGGSGG